MMPKDVEVAWACAWKTRTGWDYRFTPLDGVAVRKGLGLGTLRGLDLEAHFLKTLAYMSGDSFRKTRTLSTALELVNEVIAWDRGRPRPVGVDAAELRRQYEEIENEGNRRPVDGDEVRPEGGGGVEDAWPWERDGDA